MTARPPAADLVDRLPERIGERVRQLGDAAVRADGEFVVYWTHHAMRGHENPALDAAVLAANALRVPVLVYQGLSGRHRYNADRHHAFILEGARDLQVELAERGIRYACHLARDPRRPGPLSRLARRSALVVTEDFPAPPFPGWYERWASRLPVALWAVDTACLVPIRSVTRPFERAYEFRNAVGREQLERADRGWQEVVPEVPPFRGELGFDPFDPVASSIPDAYAACRIDHGIGPVLHTRGGSSAGYARWDRFRDAGLAGYARLRNDAAVEPPRGVSRLSPYLHYGQVSPFRIAREAIRSPADGAKKFLDELLVWRELAYNFCAHCRDPESMDALPGWARETLARHADDRRDPLIDLDRLAGAGTGDELWDLAQRSLLVHGELHNNLRMTWGKAVLSWTRSPAQALRTLVDLNHRYALDGSDPNSYGGILWCLGLFDRPFEPERPVLGVVRPRSTKAHRERLDLARYRARVERPAGGRRRAVAVVGGGPAGVAAARTLADHGHAVTLFDKARGVGGRTSVRRVDGAVFDFGAPRFAACDPRLGRIVDPLIDAGAIAPWSGHPRPTPGGNSDREPSEPSLVGVPGMNALAARLATGLDVRVGHRVARLARSAGSWFVHGERGETMAGPFDAAVVAIPAPQAADLLDASGLGALARECVDVPFEPCWAAMFLFEDRIDVPFDHGRSGDGPVAWFSRESSKPGRGRRDAWLVHASADWSRTHLGAGDEDVRRALLRLFFDALGRDVREPRDADAHRWRYARCTRPLDVECLHDPDRGVIVCGDWCLGSDVEAAVLSGIAAAGRILTRLGGGGARNSSGGT